MDWILRLQKKSPQVKSQTAFIAAGVCTGIIALVWMTTLPARLATVANVVPEHTDTALTLDALSPYAETVSKSDIAPKVEKPMTGDDIRSRVGGLIESLKDKNPTTTPVHIERAPILIEVATTSKPETPPSASDSNIGKPVLIETRSSSDSR